MGSFSATCEVSGLPIGAGDPVRFIALTQNTYHRPNEWTHYVNGRWALRSFPIKAEYNDYGSVENLENGFVTDLFFECLNTGVVERSVGENECHDVPIRKGMSREDWLRALWEGRVLSHAARDGKNLKIKVPEGVPSRKRVEKLLEDAGFRVSLHGRFSVDGPTGFTVHHVRRGQVVVRSGQFESAVAGQALEKLQACLGEHFSTMVTCGKDGGCSPRPELVVAPKYNVSAEAALWASTPRVSKKLHHLPAPVAAVMIREDVWQTLLKMAWKPGVYDNDCGPTFAKYMEQVETNVGAIIQRIESNSKLDKVLRKTKLPEYDGKHGDDFMQTMNEMSLDAPGPLSSILGFYSECHHPGFGLKSAWKLAWDKNPGGESLRNLVQVAGETARVMERLSSIRFQWKNSGSGCQFPEYGPFKAFYGAMNKLASRLDKDSRKET